MSAQPLGPMATSLNSDISEVDLKIPENNARHNTDEMGVSRLVVRRGDYFSIGLKFKVPFQPKTHSLTFTASTGKFADEDRGTKSVFGIPDVRRSPKAKAVWKAEISNYRDEFAFVNMTPPADAPVGMYQLSLDFLGQDTFLGVATVLFNPWCRADSVYLDEVDARKEYVMNEAGVIYRGSSDFIGSSVWTYGQFEDDMVDIIFELLNRNPKHYKDPVEDEGAWSDPGYVGRVISAMINSNGDQGVLEGNWSGNYAGGYSPTHWSDSHSILYLWRQSNYKPVKYGQCWVYAAVMCSVMRALGVPCRVVTNFDSAHDTDMNLIIDEFVPAFGVDDIYAPDSIWNFHVWVECWMTRPDLPYGFNGWQVLDPTPQELSEGAFQCGPASVTAIFKGNTDKDYDVPFVFAEVNADIVEWLVKADGSKSRISTNKDTVGKYISTKAIGSKKREDITDNYKHKEGSKAERTVFNYASKVVDRSENDGESDEEPEDPEEPEEPVSTADIIVNFKEASPLVNGKDVQLNLVIRNETTQPRNLSMNISVKARTYAATDSKLIQALVKNDMLLPKRELVIPVFVAFSKYSELMLNHDVMKFSALISDVDNPDDTYLAQKDVVLEDPPLLIEGMSETMQFQKTELMINFRNPTSVTLTNCSLTLSGSGILRYEQQKRMPDIPALKTLKVRLRCFPYRHGERVLVADFDCSAFRDIKKSYKINVSRYSYTGPFY